MYEFFCKREEAKNLQSKAPKSPPLYTNPELVYYQNWKLRYELISPLIRHCLLNELLNHVLVDICISLQNIKRHSFKI